MLGEACTRRNAIFWSVTKNIVADILAPDGILQQQNMLQKVQKVQKVFAILKNEILSTHTKGSLENQRMPP